MLFDQLQKDDKFRWRDKRWLKIDSSHALSIDDPELKPTFIPNCENVTPLDEESQSEDDQHAENNRLQVEALRAHLNQSEEREADTTE